MSDDTPLWLLIANTMLGVVLILWVAVTLVPFLFGAEPLLPEMELAFFSMCAWAGWNSHLILRKLP
jgi:hypothetical protein